MYNKTWIKYLPVVRILLKRSATAEQKMDLTRMDFESGGARNRKLACNFNIELENGKLVALTQSVTAKSLVEVLQQDDAAKLLLRKKHYKLSLNSAFQLTINDLTPTPESIEGTEGTEADPATETETEDAEKGEAVIS